MRRTLPLIAGFFLLATGIVKLAYAAPADLDPTFGSGGLVVTPPVPIPELAGGQTYPAAIAVQPDGKILLAVQACMLERIGCVGDPLALIRYNKDGSVDSTFGVNGLVKDFGHTQLFAMVVQPDGKIVLLGGAQGTYWLMRLDPFGTPDTTFGDGASEPVPSGLLGPVLLQQADGKLLLGGVGQFGAQPPRVAVVRLNIDGSPDPSYGTNGVAIHEIDRVGSIEWPGLAATLQSDGKIVVIGEIRNTNQGSRLFAVRFDTTGTPDVIFGSGTGVVQASFTAAATSGDIVAAGVRQQPDGKLVLAGTQFTLLDFGPQLALLQLNADGSIDDSFGVLGRVVVRTMRSITATSALWPDDHPMFVGTETRIDTSGFVHNSGFLTRLAPDGSLDSGFGDCGTAEFPYPVSVYPTALVVASQPDGKLVASGFEPPPEFQATSNQFALVRLQGNHSTSVYFTDVGPNPARDGQSVALGARVIGRAPFGSTVTFMDGGTPVSSCTAVPVTTIDSASASAQCAAVGLGVGRHILTATYDGEPDNPQASSCPVIQFVDQADRVTVIEYYNDVLDDYFITTLASEVAALDSDAIHSWSRTGQSFQVHPLDQLAGSLPVCRFFSGPTFAPVSSHFFTPLPYECAAVQQDPRWAFEGLVFGLDLPSVPLGYCPIGQAPLYRLYNKGMNGAPNHRYLTDQSTADQMFNDGWIFEGLGDPGTIGCVWE